MEGVDRNFFGEGAVPQAAVGPVVNATEQAGGLTGQGNQSAAQAAKAEAGRSSLLGDVANQGAAAAGQTVAQVAQAGAQAQAGLQQGTQTSQTVAQQAGQTVQQPGQESGQALEQAQQAREAVANQDPERMPISDFSKVDLGLGEERVNPRLLSEFGRTAVEIGLTPEQARALAKMQIESVRKEEAELLESQRKIMRQAWGRDYERNLKQVDAFCKRLDRLQGLEGFYDEIQACGGASNAKVVLALHYLDRMFGEDMAGAEKGGALGRPQTAYEGIVEAYANAHKGNSRAIFMK